MNIHDFVLSLLLHGIVVLAVSWCVEQPKLVLLFVRYDPGSLLLHFKLAPLVSTSDVLACGIDTAALSCPIMAPGDSHAPS